MLLFVFRFLRSSKVKPQLREEVGTLRREVVTLRGRNDEVT